MGGHGAGFFGVLRGELVDVFVERVDLLPLLGDVQVLLFKLRCECLDLLVFGVQFGRQAFDGRFECSFQLAAGRLVVFELLAQLGDEVAVQLHGTLYESDVLFDLLALRASRRPTVQLRTQLS